MQEQSKREESLSEELLDRVTGAGCCASTRRNPEPGSFLNCGECQQKARMFGEHITTRDWFPQAADNALAQGNTLQADRLLKAAGEHHKLAQEAYGAMEAHGHPDFPAALRQQRLHYNPG